MMAPVVQPSLCMQVPVQTFSPCAPAQQTCVISSPFPHMQMQPCSPCTLHMQSPHADAALQPVQLATAQMQPCSPCTPVPMQACMQVPPSPTPPEVFLTEEAGVGGLCIRWQSVGPVATGYVLELGEGSLGSIERFVRHVPPQTVGAVELCVGGLVPGRCYAACVRSISQSGHESAPSAWSNWQNIPAAMLPRLPSAPQNVEKSVLEAEVKKVGMAAVLFPPEVTGNEEGMLFLD